MQHRIDISRQAETHRIAVVEETASADHRSQMLQMRTRRIDDPANGPQIDESYGGRTRETYGSEIRIEKTALEIRARFQTLAPSLDEIMLGGVLSGGETRHGPVRVCIEE